MAELNVGVLLSSLKNVGFVTERVSKDDVASFVDELLSSVEASVCFGDVCLNKNLIV